MANLNSVRLPVSFTSIMLLDIANRYLLFANSFYFQHFVILLVIYALAANEVFSVSYI